MQIVGGLFLSLLSSGKLQRPRQRTELGVKNRRAHTIWMGAHYRDVIPAASCCLHAGDVTLQKKWARWNARFAYCLLIISRQYGACCFFLPSFRLFDDFTAFFLFLHTTSKPQVTAAAYEEDFQFPENKIRVNKISSGGTVVFLTL